MLMSSKSEAMPLVWMFLEFWLLSFFLSDDVVVDADDDQDGGGEATVVNLLGISIVVFVVLILAIVTRQSFRFTIKQFITQIWTLIPHTTVCFPTLLYFVWHPISAGGWIWLKTKCFWPRAMPSSWSKEMDKKSLVATAVWQSRNWPQDVSNICCFSDQFPVIKEFTISRPILTADVHCAVTQVIVKRHQFLNMSLLVTTLFW